MGLIEKRVETRLLNAVSWKTELEASSQQNCSPSDCPRTNPTFTPDTYHRCFDFLFFWRILLLQRGPRHLQQRQ